MKTLNSDGSPTEQGEAKSVLNTIRHWFQRHPPRIQEHFDGKTSTDDVDLLDAEALAEDQPFDHILRWDLDKTYLLTEFDTVGDLLRTALEKPEEKQTIPGAIPLIQCLLEATSQSHRRALYFVSGSPEQMRSVLEKKLALDGIRPDAFVLKPNLQNLIKFRFKALKSQLGYKLRALLSLQVKDHPQVQETLFGDDVEEDAEIYSIYAEIVAGRLRQDELIKLLQEAEVYPDEVQAILTLAQEITPFERVQRIIIHLARRQPLVQFQVYGPRLVPVFNYFQAALVLLNDGLLHPQHIGLIWQHMVDQDGYSPLRLADSFQDLLRRKVLAPASFQTWGPLLSDQDQRLCVQKIEDLEADPPFCLDL